MAVNVHRERDIVRLKFIHIEFSSLSIYLHTAKLGCEIDDWKSFNLSIESLMSKICLLMKIINTENFLASNHFPEFDAAFVINGI